MLQVEGHSISGLPFGELTLVSELLLFEGKPILVHFQDGRKSDVLAYWVDFDRGEDRWLYASLTKQEIFNYITGITSLRDTLQSIQSEFIFVVDVGHDEKIISSQIINSYSVPEKYFPSTKSFFKKGTSDYYKEYLKDSDYWSLLRAKATIFKIEPSDLSHDHTVGARQAAFVLNNVSNSMEGFVSVRAGRVLREDFGDQNKISRRVNKLKEFLSPRIALSKAASFEVWLTMDVITFHGSDPYDSKIRQNLIEDYKNDVVDMDFTNEGDAKLISEKYKEDERELIYEPLIKVFENDQIKVSVSEHTHKGKITGRIRNMRVSDSFKKIVLPPPTLEELEKKAERKNKIMQFFINIKEGDKIKKQHLVENMLFKREAVEAPYEIESPIKVEHSTIHLAKPILCIFRIDSEGKIELFNTLFDLFATGNELPEVVEDIKRQIVRTKELLDITPEDKINKTIEEQKKYFL